MTAAVSHVLTIDLEDWFHCLEPDPAGWDNFVRRAEIELEILLPILDRCHAKATFFVLGDVARAAPQLVPELVRRGHEVGTHGMEHRMLTAQTPAEFRDDLRCSLDLLAAQSGQAVRSYRAPYFTITRDTLWALDILAEEGIRIDSSIFPVRNPRYGIHDAPRTPHRIRPTLTEWPISTLATRLGNVPFAGGVYFRFLPRRYLDFALRVLERRGEPVVFYLHPWEVDPDQPRHRPPSRFLYWRHYFGLRSSAAKLEHVLRRAPFVSLALAAANGHCAEQRA